MKRSRKKYQTKQSDNKSDPEEIKQVSIMKHPCMRTTEDQMKELQEAIK